MMVWLWIGKGVRPRNKVSWVKAQGQGWVKCACAMVRKAACLDRRVWGDVVGCLWRAPIESPFWGLCRVLCPPLWVAWVQWLAFLRDRMQKKWWRAISKISLQSNCDFHRAHTLLHHYFLWRKLADMWWAALQRGPCGKELMWCLQSTASEDLRGCNCHVS